MWRSIFKKSTKHSYQAKNKRIEISGHANCCEENLATINKSIRINKRTFFSSNRKNREFSHNVVVSLGNREPLQLDFGKLARFADGSCVASIGATSVLVTAVSKKSSNLQDSSNNVQSIPPATFVPLTVDYRQKAAAAGRIPTNHLRRELGPTENEILTSRVIDRSLRPLFPKGYGAETQIICNLLSTDGSHDPSVVALNGASAALALSDIPWNGPIGAARVAYSNSFTNGTSGFVLNPTRKELRTISEQSGTSLNMLVSGDKNGLVVMLEADAGNLDRSLFFDAIKFGLESSSTIAKYIHSESIAKKIIKRPNPYLDSQNDNQSSENPQYRAYNLMELLCEQKLKTIFEDKNHDKTSRDNATFSLRDNAISQIRNNNQFSSDPSFLYDAFTKISRKLLSSLVLDQNIRVDGREIDEIRTITCNADTHPPLHGSALFQRGQTQVFCTVSLDSLESTALKIDPVSSLMGGAKEKNFFLHYEFPPFATNEIGRSGAASGRRELGHGALAEKGLRAVVPKDHPFTIRLTSEVLESNGSSSMASICGGSLALLDAGVPLTSPAAGVAMGLVSRVKGCTGTEVESTADHDNNEYKVLTDILGMEDFLGDMDFKVAGTRNGITALQADIKLPGIPLHIVETALTKGHKAINRIIDIMESSREEGNEPRLHKENWPMKETVNVPAHKRGRFIGPGGSNVKRILAETGVQITPESGTEASTTWSLFAPNSEALNEAKEIIDKILTEEKLPELEFGSIYPSIIREIRERGVMVELHPEMPLVLVPNSQLDAKKISHPSVLGLVEGQEMRVKYYGRDPVTGSLRVSRKALTVGSVNAVKQLKTGRNAGISMSKIEVSTIGHNTPNNSSDNYSSAPTEGIIRANNAYSRVQSQSLKEYIGTVVDELSEQDPTDLKKEMDQRYHEIDEETNKLMSIELDLKSAMKRRSETLEMIDKLEESKQTIVDKTRFQVIGKKLSSLIFKDKAIEEIVDTYVRLKKEKEKNIKTHKIRLIELKKTLDTLDKVATQANQAKVNHHKKDPLKEKLRNLKLKKTSSISSVKDSKVERDPKHAKRCIQNSIQPLREFDNDITKNKKYLNYNERDYIEENLMQLTKFEDEDSSVKSDNGTLKGARAFFKSNNAENLEPQDILDRFQNVVKYSYIPETKCTKHFDSVLDKDLTDFKILKKLCEKGGSRKSGRSQKDMIFESVANLKHAISLWRKLHYNTQLYLSSHLVFAYHDALKMSQENIQIAEQEEIFRMVTKGIDNEAPLKAEEIKELIRLIKTYSNKIEHSSGFEHRLMLKPDLNDWIHNSSFKSQLTTKDDVLKLVKKLASQRLNIQSLKTLHVEYEQKISEYTEKIKRIGEYIENHQESHIVMREHQNIRQYEKEIEVLRYELDGPNLKLMEIDIQLFKSTLAPFIDIIETKQKPDQNEYTNSCQITISPWCYYLDQQNHEIFNYFSNAIHAFLNMQGEWKEELLDLDKMNLDSDYIVYMNKKEKIQLLSKKLFQCYSEICKVKHLLQCVTQENVQNQKDFKFIRNYFEKHPVHSQSDLGQDNKRDSSNWHLGFLKHIPALTYEEIKHEEEEVKDIILGTEKEIENMCVYLLKTLPYDYSSIEYDDESNKRLAEFEKYEINIKQVMKCKSEKINTIRRNYLLQSRRNLAFYNK